MDPTVICEENRMDHWGPHSNLKSAHAVYPSVICETVSGLARDPKVICKVICVARDSTVTGKWGCRLGTLMIMENGATRACTVICQ